MATGRDFGYPAQYATVPGLFQGFKSKLLPPDGNLVHQTALGVNEGGHAFVIFSCQLGSGLGAGTGTGAGTGGSDLGLGSCSYCDCLDGGAEFEIAAGKFIVSPLILQENDFAESFGTRLKSDRSLNYR